MKKLLTLCAMLLCIIGVQATDYTTYLTTERGFTEVTNISQISSNYYYILTSAENNELIVGIGAYQAKPDWASGDSKALRYKSADTDPMLDRTNFFIIEKNLTNIAFRNLVYSGDLFQTHGDAAYMYVNTFTCKIDTDWEWASLKPTYQDGYWKFEEDKYSGNFLGPWSNIVAENEPIAGNRTDAEGDEAGHFRIFCITRANYEAFYQNTLNAMREALISASSSNPIDATFLITNPSFETGDYTGWTPTGDLENNVEIGAKTSVTTNGEGGYTFNGFQWWTDLSISQTADIPSGIYDVSAVVAAWEIDNVTFSAGASSVTNVGLGDMTGIPVTLQSVIVGYDNKLTISAATSADWWSDGRSTDTDWRYACGFFKLDKVQLACKGLYLSAIAQPLPNNTTTVLTADQWYYYDIPAVGKYALTGNLIGMAYTEEGYTLYTEVSEKPVKSEMGFSAGRVFFKTKRSDATLKVEPTMDINTFTVATLNVDGLPNKILTQEINPDGPGSDGTKLISSFIASQAYDIVALSEDFNYHSELISNLGDAYNIGTHRATIGASQLYAQANTDGLGLLVRKNANFSNESWTKFSTSASTWDGSKAIKKGFRYYLITLATGEVIDVYITHMDAGDDGVNYRPAQIKQIANAIIADGNTNRPKIFMGDTNCRWTREDLQTNFMDVLSGTYDVSDAWVELTHNNVYPIAGTPSLSDEVVDKIFYLNPKGKNAMKLTPISYLRDSEHYVKADGTALGDHAPVVVNFTIAYEEAVDNTVMLGNVHNEDNVLTIQDVADLVDILLSNDESNPVADVNQDGYITLSDVTALVNLMNKK